MTPEILAAIHAQCFDGTPRPWSAKEFAGSLALPSALLVCCNEGFALGRVAGPEAELTTLAVLPEARRRGVARRLLADLEERARERGACEVFLEVAEGNRPARALYLSAGYRSAGFRRDYYRSPTGCRIGALVLRKALFPER